MQDGGIDIHPHRWQGSPTDDNPSNALHLRQFLLQDGGGHVVHAGSADHVRGEGQNQHRGIRRIALAIEGVAWQVGRQLTARGVNRRLHITCGSINVPAQVELQGDSRGAERTDGGHFVQPGNASELAFERRGHCGGHDFRAGAR